MTAAITATPTATISHLLFFILLPDLEIPSLVPQRFDWIEQGRFPRRVIAEKHTDGDREQRRHDDGFERHLHRPLQRLSHEIGTDNSEQDSRRSADETQHDGL